MDNKLNNDYLKVLNTFFKKVAYDLRPISKNKHEIIDGKFYIIDNGLHCEITKVPFVGTVGYCINFYTIDDDYHINNWYAVDNNIHSAIENILKQIPKRLIAYK